MKILVVLAAVLLAVKAASDSELWAEFKQKYGVQYSSPNEEQERFAIFQNNLRIIEEHNKKYMKGETTYWMGINKFADRTKEEMQSMMGYNGSTGEATDSQEAYQAVWGSNAP